MTLAKGVVGDGSSFAQSPANRPHRLHPEKPDHDVVLYTNAEQLGRRVAAYLREGLDVGDALVVILRATHWTVVEQQLNSSGVDVAALRTAGQITCLDATATLERLLKDGIPDANRFEAVIGQLVRDRTASVAPPARVRTCGEMVDILWHGGHPRAALRLEQLWNDLHSRIDFQLLCAYSIDGFLSDRADIASVLAVHAHALLDGGEQSEVRDPVPDDPAELHAYVGSLRTAILRQRGVDQSLRTIVGELQAQEATLREREAQVRSVADAVPVLLSFVDVNQRIQFASAAHEAWFGHSDDGFLGKHLAEVFGPTAYSALLPHIEKALEGTSVTFDAELPQAQGGTRFIEATYIPKHSHGAVTGFVAHIADVTRRRAFEQSRAAEASRADRLLRITAAIADSISAEEVYVALVDSVAAAIGASSAGLWLLEESGLRLARSRGYSPVAAEQLAWLSLKEPRSLPILDAVRGNEALWIDSKAELLRRYPHLEPVTTPARRYKVACLPLSSQGRVLGGLGLSIESEGRMANEERELLLLVARYASQALERVRLLESERASRAAANAAAHRVEAMARVSRAFVESDLTLSARLNVVSAELSAALDGCINIALLEPDHRLHFVAVHHPMPEAQALLQTVAAQTPVGIGDGVTGMIAQSRRSVLLPALDADEIAARAPVEYRPFLRSFPPSALIGAPLIANGRLIGTVTATRVRSSQTYDSADLQLLEELADRAAVAIENSRLYQETVDGRKRADLLYGFAQAVSSASSLDEVCTAALSTIEAALGTPRLAILIGDHDGRPRFRAWQGLSDEYRRAVDGHSPWATGAASYEPVLVRDACNDPALTALASLFNHEGIRALGFFPLVMRGKLLGKFMVYREKPHDFQPREVEVAMSIANHLASVVTRFSAINRLEETLKANELFAAVLAHDLRNPLGAIMHSAQLVLMRQEGRGDLGDVDDSQPISRILRSGQRMTAMIDQLLDFTRARSGGGIHVDPHSTDLAELAVQAGSELELAHPAWRVKYETRGNAGGVWDAARMLQVISNLVANAGNHGTDNRDIRILVDGTDGASVRLQVTNAGTIDESIRANVFEPFFGSRRAEHAGMGGLGLGLFIVREIVRAHRGTVSLECTESETVVTVELPRAAV